MCVRVCVFTQFLQKSIQIEFYYHPKVYSHRLRVLYKFM